MIDRDAEIKALDAIANCCPFHRGALDRLGEHPDWKTYESAETQYQEGVEYADRWLLGFEDAPPSMVEA